MPRGSKKEKDVFTVPVQYKHIPYAKHNSVQFSFVSLSNNYRMQEMICGCKKEDLEQDLNLPHTALSAAMYQMFEDKLLSFKNTKNQQIELRQAFLNGKHVFTFILPPVASSIKQAVAVIKKVVGKKVVSKSVKLLSQFDKKYVQEKGKSEIQESLITILHNNSQVVVYGKKKFETNAKQNEFVDVLESKLTIQKIPSDGKGGVKTNIMGQLPEIDTVYKQILNFSSIDKAIRAIIVVGMQSAGFDFFLKNDGSQLFLNKAHCRPEYINMIKQLLSSRLRFLTKKQPKEDAKSKEKLDKKMYSLVAFVYQQGCYTQEVSQDILQLKNKHSEIQKWIDLFVDIVLESEHQKPKGKRVKSQKKH